MIVRWWEQGCARLPTGLATLSVVSIGPRIREKAATGAGDDNWARFRHESPDTRHEDDRAARVAAVAETRVRRTADRGALHDRAPVAARRELRQHHLQGSRRN